VSKQQRKALQSLKANIKRNAPIVEKKIALSGTKPDPALVYAAAKYYPTLRRLAKE
jgi:hypothetical protein